MNLVTNRSAEAYHSQSKTDFGFPDDLHQFAYKLGLSIRRVALVYMLGLETHTHTNSCQVRLAISWSNVEPPHLHVLPHRSWQFPS